MALRPASSRLTAASLQLVCLWLLSLSARFAAAQDSNNAQGALLYSMGKWLTNDDIEKLTALGWVNGGNPCSGTWTGVTCTPEGYVSNVALPNQGLIGSLPPESSIWGGLTGLTSVDLSGNSLGGPVPSQLSAAGPQLTSINLSGNTDICGTNAAPAGVTVNTDATKYGTDCNVALPPAPTASPAASPEPVVAVPPNATATPPAADTNSSSTTPATDASPAPEEPAAGDAAAAETPVELPSSPAAPPPAPVPISDAPVCSCALRGFGSDECASAVKGVCSGGANAPALCTAGANGTLVDPSTDETAAQQLGQYLSDACFTNQDKNTNICTCVQNLLGTDCAKARVSLCVSKDPSCLPFQNIIDINGSSSADTVSKVAPVLNDKCPITQPTVPGVKATMEFPTLSMGQYINKQYTQNVANALSAVTNVPSGSISALDVRPVLGQPSTQGRRRGRALMQSGGSGVQATYFLTTSDPGSVSQALSTAAQNGQLSKQLGQYGITSPAGSLKVQSFVPAPAASSAPASSSSGTPAWVAAPIIIGILLLGALAFLIFFCIRRNKKAKEYAPSTKQSDQALPVAKSFEYTPAPVTGYPATADSPGKVARPGTPEDLPVSRSIKMSSADQADAANWAADTAPADGPINLSPIKMSAEAAAGGAAAGSAAAAWKSNVRPASGQVPSGGAATSSMAGAKNAQQAERAKFWAQFQETWQQVRQNQNINDEPGTPSSGTNWTDITGQHSPKKHSGTGEPGQ